MDELKEIQDWYRANCDGSWEHEFGVEIGTLDNPGWSVKIDLAGTQLEQGTFEEVEQNLGDDDWYTCHIENGAFVGFGDPTKLETLLRKFLTWSKT